VEKVYEPKSIHLYRGTFIHSFIETLHNISLREQGINKNNFETKLEEVAQAQFTRMIDEPTNNFGNPGPTFRQQLVELFGDDEQAIDEALEDTAEMLNVYIQKKLIDLRVWTKKYNSFAKAWNASKPKFKEFPIKLDNFMGSIDEVYEIDGEIVISDLKSSTLATGRDPNSDRYMQRGMTGLNKEYILQLFLYAWAYHKQTGIMPDWLSLNYIKHGHEVLVPFKFMDRKAICDRMEVLVNEFLEATKSKDVNDYPCNACNNLKVSSGFSLENNFCSAPGTRFAGRGFCFYDTMCEAHGNIEEFTVRNDKGDATHHGIYILKEIESPLGEIIVTEELHMLSAWLFDKKNIPISGSVKFVKETEKALLVEGENAAGVWIPKSQIKRD
jgi:hypothetical protein